MDSKIMDEMKAWQEKVKELSSAAGRNVSRDKPVVREQLRDYKDLAKRYNKPGSRDEKLARKVLKTEIRRLEKLAYPKRIERNIRKGIEVTGKIINWLTEQKAYTPANKGGNTVSKESSDLIRPSKESNKKEQGQSQGKDETRNLDKSVGQYQKNPGKDLGEDDLLPKLRQSKGKRLGM